MSSDQIRGKLRIWTHLLKKSLMENFIFYAVYGWHLDIALYFLQCAIFPELMADIMDELMMYGF